MSDPRTERERRAWRRLTLLDLAGIVAAFAVGCGLVAAGIDGPPDERKAAIGLYLGALLCGRGSSRRKGGRDARAGLGPGEWMWDGYAALFGALAAAAALARATWLPRWPLVQGLVALFLILPSQFALVFAPITAVIGLAGASREGHAPGEDRAMERIGALVVGSLPTAFYASMIVYMVTR